MGFKIESSIISRYFLDTRPTNCSLIFDLTYSFTKDIIALGIPEGPLIKDILNSLFEGVVDKTFKNTPKALKKEILKIKDDFS